MNLETPINILVRRRAAIGDVIMSTGVVRELKRLYGDNCNIDIATECIEVYRNNPHIRHICHTNVMPDIGSYDHYINLDDAYELNPMNNYLDSYFYRAFGHTDSDQRPELYPSDEDKTAVLNTVYQNELDKYVVVHMRNWHWGAKNISMDIWLDVFTRLFEQRTDFKIVCVGGNTDFYIEDHPLFVDVRGVYNSQQLKHLCDDAACFVGIDSGPFHCAAASKTHIVALLTHLHPNRIVPMGASYVQTNEDCRGCNDDQTRPVRQLICKKVNYPCVNNFDTEAITQAILRTLT
jgi:ADP-heptose:LPS heptosyltransferase